MDPRQVALAFVQHFCAGEVAALARLLAEDLRFEGPRLRCESRAAYLAAYLAAPPRQAPCEVLQVLAEGDQAAVFYRYGHPPHALAIAQSFWVRGGLIQATQVYFHAQSPPPGQPV